MRKTKVKKLREEFENTIAYMKAGDKMRGSVIYNRLWRKFKKEHEANAQV